MKRPAPKVVPRFRTHLQMTSNCSLRSGASGGIETSPSIIVLMTALARRPVSDSCLLSLAKGLFLADAECQISTDTWRHMPAMASKFQSGAPVHASLSDSSHEVTQDRSRGKRQVPPRLSSRHSTQSTSRCREFHISDTRTPLSPRCPQNLSCRHKRRERELESSHHALQLGQRWQVLRQQELQVQEIDE